MNRTKSLIQIALMSTLIVILGLMPPLPLGFIPVPIVLQNLGIMLAAILLGAKKGSLAILIFLILGLFLPVFTGGGTTLVVFAGPTAGYVVGWLLMPLALAGLRRLLLFSHPLISFALVWLSGVLLVDVIGAIYLAHYTNAPLLPSLLSNLVFIPGDSIKAAIATIIGTKYRKQLGLE
ncbi:biotin transporter BioY [Streptococcus pluranimalium]|uniref:Biotin transporter n=1 Tax=Streptococcus pluranimalium TaxID=82348 RepID=A0A2L0D673_9STRE|nr:biotin transporter BioY [Streptococcus pluranimalium]AUW97343.1 biotin transporter BioY [Streptococcus pluranimalium]